MKRYLDAIENIRPAGIYFSPTAVNIVTIDGVATNLPSNHFVVLTSEVWVPDPGERGADPKLMMLVLWGQTIGRILVTVGWLAELQHFDKRTHVLFNENGDHGKSGNVGTDPQGDQHGGQG